MKRQNKRENLPKSTSIFALNNEIKQKINTVSTCTQITL